MTKTKLFLDVDGVINAFFPHKQYGVLEEFMAEAGTNSWYKIRYSPQMIEDLRALDLDLYWTTTWRHAAKENIAPVIGYGEDSKVLTPHNNELTWPSIDWKYDAVKAVVEYFPGPFIWIDDELTHVVNDHSIDMSWAEHGLILSPDSGIGISPREMERIREYVNGS
jgi:hypothetical protein